MAAQMSEEDAKKMLKILAPMAIGMFLIFVVALHRAAPYKPQCTTVSENREGYHYTLTFCKSKLRDVDSKN